MITKIQCKQSDIFTLSENEKNYIAGILDGEGCINKRKTKWKNGEEFYWRISISNTCPELIYWLKKKIPQSKIYKNRPPRQNEKQAWTFCIFKWYFCYFFIKEIFPFLIVKKKIAKQLLQSIKKRYCIKGNIKSLFFTEPEIDSILENEITKKIKEKFFITDWISKIQSSSRKKSIIGLKRFVVKILKDEMKWSFPEIGKFLKRDHTSIINLYNK